MKPYVGSAKNAPDSRTPRRLSAASTTTSDDRHRSPRAAATQGIAEAAFWTPEEIDTATVRT